MPDGKQTWNACSNIQKCDMARYALMYKKGGLYADIDCVPSKKIAESLRGNLNFFLETIWVNDEVCQSFAKRYEIREGKPEVPVRIANYAMCARVPGHKVWLKIWRTARDRLLRFPDPPKTNLRWEKNYYVIFTTGPDVVSQVLHDLADPCECDVVMRWMLKHESRASWCDNNKAF